MEGPISFWGYREQESNLILPEHDDDDDDDDELQLGSHPVAVVQYTYTHKQYRKRHKTNNT
jgi:hypothetical protein